MSSKVAIITGASSGLGRGTASVFLGAGWDVALAARSEDELRDLADAHGRALPVARLTPS